MATSCSIKLNAVDPKVSAELSAIVGNNKELEANIYGYSIKNGEFTPEFIDYVNNRKKGKGNPTAKTIAKMMQRHYDIHHPSIETSTRIDGQSDISMNFDYPSVFAREEGKSHSVNVILDLYNAVQNSGTELGKNKLAYYKTKLKDFWLNTIINHAAQLNGESAEVIKREYDAAEDKFTYIKSKFKKMSDDVTYKACLAVYQELFGSPSDASNYINEIFSDSKLQYVLQDVKGELDAEANRMAIEGLTDENDISSENEVDKDELDMSITAFNNHIGSYTSYLVHVGSRIKNYLNSLRKLNSPTIGDVDTNNIFGIAETMDATTCCTMLYNRVNSNSIDEFIDSIEQIGKTTSGFEAFVQLAKDLRENLDFAIEMRTTFAKLRVAKFELVRQGDKTIWRTSNAESNPASVVRNKLFNDIRSSAIDAVSDIVEHRLHDITEAINNVNANAIITVKSGNTDAVKAKIDELRPIVEDIIVLIKYYYPSIDPNAIKAFVAIANGADTTNGNLISRIRNIEDLVRILDRTRKDANKVRSAKIQLDIQAAQIREANKALEKKNHDNNKWTNPMDLLDAKSVYQTDYANEATGTIIDLTNMLIPYMSVDTSYNSRNIHGNNNSDIINASWLMNFSRMLENTVEKNIKDDRGVTRRVLYNPTLIKWGEKKLKSKQFKYSNILLTQVDENGNHLNEGLFEYIGDALVINPKAKELIDVFNFNGSSNMDTGVSESYNEMLMGSYLPTSFLAYFNTQKNNGETIDRATYFLRTPSDAPKHFAVKMPRYSTKGLVQIANEDAFNQSIQDLTYSKYAKLTKDTLPKYLNTAGGVPVTEIDSSEINDVLFPEENPNHSIFIKNFNSIKIIEHKSETNEFETAYVTYIVTDANSPLNGTIIVLEGTVKPAGKGKRLESPKLVGITATTAEENEAVSDYIAAHYSKLLKTQDVEFNGKSYNKAEYALVTSHPVFTLLKNQFKQELLDAATALNCYFELDDNDNAPGTKVVRLTKNGSTLEPVFKDGRSNTKGYKYYHLGKKDTVFEKSKDGIGVTLGGKVFHSNKFTAIVRDEESGELVERNFLDDIITTDINRTDDGSINLLYGGGFAMVTDEQGDVVDIKLSDAQNAKIDEALNNFIKTYIDQSSETINEYKDFIDGVPLSIDNIIDYSINQLLTHYSFDDIFEGSSKFYKDSQTILKRAKEVQGSGVPYGICDYNSFSEYSLDDVAHSYLNEGVVTRKVVKQVTDPKTHKTKNVVVTDENGQPVRQIVSIQNLLKGGIFEGVRQRKGFRAVTVKNSVATNNEALEIIKTQLIQQLKAENFSDKIAEAKAMDILYGPKDADGKRRGGFTATKVNDAQSYITVQEWGRRIAARGQLGRYLPLIEKLNNPNAELSSSDIKEFIQVQKNFYYDLYYDERYKVEVPRQIKNAEFVLVPQLIKGTQLEQVYDMMHEANIDQLNTVETSKAANEELLTLWDNNGDISAECRAEFASKADRLAQIYSYNYLYTQQETPQHMNAQNKAGIQIMKKIIDNLPTTGPLAELKNEFFAIYSSKIAASFQKLVDELEIPVDEFGNIKLDDNGCITGLNRKVFYDKLKEELIRTGIDSNLLDYVTLDGNTPLMPCEMNNILPKFESIVQSIFNSSITRQKLPGFHSPQITNVGWKSMEDDLLKLKDSQLFNNSIFKRFCDSTNTLATLNNGKLDQEVKDKFKEWIKKTMPSYAKELKYHIETDDNGNVKHTSYIEVVVPYSYLGIDKNSAHYKNMSDDEILAELKAEGENGKHGLDSIIGYRIPTEGKQSICNMRIVGFIDDAYGSTIIVPNDWVSQTGSDFDVDSVYAIQYESRKTSDGRIRKIKYRKDITKSDWFYKLRKEAEREINANASAAKIEHHAKVKEIFDGIYTSLQEIEQDAYDTLDEQYKIVIKETHLKIKKTKAYKDLNPREAYVYSLTTVSNILKTVTKFRSPEEKVAIENLISILDDISSYVNDKYNFLDITHTPQVQQIVDNAIETLNSSAKDLNIETLDEYLSKITKKTPLELNTDAAKNTRILEIMQDILDDPATLEETLYRSQFSDLVAGRDIVMSKDTTTSRVCRSPYNVFDEMRYQEEAMSGAKLKANSVSLDTFCSVCNTVKPVLTKPIVVVYNAEHYKDSKVVDRYSPSYNKDKTKFSIAHSQYGWSIDNRNMADKLITPYSSQTTAFILDAIKEGSIPNVNEYTFGVFKTLPNIGMDYRSIMAFIMQPAVSRIIKEHTAVNSVFSKKHGNPINNSIKAIAKELGLKLEAKTTVIEAMKMLQERYGKQYAEIFGDDCKISFDDKDLANLPILVDECIDRSKGKGAYSSTPVEESDDAKTRRLLFDLGNVLQFYKIRNIANEVGNIARCCNPDKFGAKQTVFATRQVFETIDRSIYGNGIKRNKKTPILTVNNEHILEAIYPGITSKEGGRTEVIKAIVSSTKNTSAYSTLYAFLKYASATSVCVAKTIFGTQSDQFIGLVEGLTSVLTDDNFIISEDRYNDFQKYVLSSMYKEVKAIKYPLKVRTVDGKLDISLAYDPDNPDNNISPENAATVELNRIYGYERPTQIARYERAKVVNEDGTPVIGDDGKQKYKTRLVPFEVQDINNPTDEEMSAFEQLSPAQKVTFIKKNFTQNAGVFSLIREVLNNPRATGKRKGMQTIEYIEQNLSPNIAYAEFKKAFFNNNPLVVSTAIDLVKYSIAVDGYRMTSRGVNKVIDNDCLINEFGPDGLGFVQEFRDMLFGLESGNSIYFSDSNRKTLYENYVRSHYEDMSEIKTVYLTKANKAKYGLGEPQFGCYIINRPDAGENSDAKLDDMLVDMGARKRVGANESVNANTYIKFNINGEVKLFRICDFSSYVIFYPLNKLEENENSTWSCNEDNNTVKLSSKAYLSICMSYSMGRTEHAFTYEYIKDKAEELKQKEDIPVYYNARRERHIAQEALDFNLEQEAKDSSRLRGSLSTAYSAIQTHLSSNSNVTLYLHNLGLSQFILSDGVAYGSIQKIKVNGSYKKVRIIKDTLGINKLYREVCSSKTSEKTAKTITTNSYVTNILASALATGIKPGYIDDVYRVEIENDSPIVNGGFASDYEEYREEVLEAEDAISSLVASNVDIINFMYNQSQNKSDREAANLLYQLKINDVHYTAESVNENKTLSTKVVGIYAKKLATRIDNMFKAFCEDPDLPGVYLSIDDPKVQTIIKDNRHLQEKYLAVCNLATAFSEKFGAYRQISVESEHEDIKYWTDKIKDALKVVEKLPIRDVQMSFNHTIADKISTNPLIKDGLIDIMDNYWRSYGSMWKFNDIMENGSPLIQVILKDVYGDIEAKRIHIIKVKEVFRAAVESIIKEGLAKGERVNWEKLVVNGKWTRDYTEEFATVLEARRQARDEAALKYGQGSIEHLRAQNDYNLFIAYYCNQEADPRYYQMRCNEVETMLHDHPQVYSEYMTLYYEYLDLKNYKDKGEWSAEKQEEYNKVHSQMNNLRDGVRYVSPSGTIYDFTDGETDGIHTHESAAALNNYLNTMANLNQEYFEYEEDYGFRDLLERNLELIERLEQPDRNGIPTVDQQTLNENPKYVEAKNWLAENARYTMDTESEGSIFTKLKAAFSKLFLDKDSKMNIIKKYCSERNDGKGINDAAGVPNAQLLTDAEIAAVKKMQRDAYYRHKATVFDELYLIGNVHPNTGVFYTKEFYQGMGGKGVRSDEYYAQVTIINNILEKYYNPVDKCVHLEEVPDTPEGIAELRSLATAYNAINAMKNGGGEEVKAFIAENVDFVTDTDLFKQQLLAIKDAGKSSEFQAAVANVMFIDNTFTKELEPNRFLYGYCKPKDSKPEFVDKDKTEAIQLIESVYKKVPTKYYHQKKAQMLKLAKERNDDTYKVWYEANHIYNPRTRKQEPLECWMYSEVKAEVAKANKEYMRWSPTNDFSVRKVKDGSVAVEGMTEKVYIASDDRRNPNYKKDAGLLGNYMGEPGNKYTNTVVLNETEKKVRDYVTKTLLDTATTDKVARFFSNGYLPRARKEEAATAKMVGKEMLKTFGINPDIHSGTSDYQKALSYGDDFMPDMPMTTLLKNKNTYDYEKKKADTEKLIKKLESKETLTDDDINKLKELNEVLADCDKHIMDINNSLLNENWIDVVCEYLEAAGRYNAINENREKLYHLLNMLRTTKAYNKTYGHYGNLETDRGSTSDVPLYNKTVDENTLKQYETVLRRLLFDQWKQKEGALTKAADFLQGFTSANYMMLNVKGGVANVTLGATGILAEAAAQEYFGKKHWAFGTAEWNKGLLSYGKRGFMIDRGNTDTYSKQDALIQLFAVVDYDEKAGVVREISLNEYSAKLRDVLFSPQNIGEHFMQNSVLFAMLDANKLVTMSDGTTTYMTKNDYIRYKRGEILNTVLTDEQKEGFVKFKKEVKADKQKLKDYAWFRRDTLTDYIYLHCSDEQIAKFTEATKKAEKAMEEEFDKLPTFYDNFEYKDNKLVFRDGSVLAALNEREVKGANGVTEAEALLGRFTEKVRKVNNKIHGVYNRQGAAYIESKWFGSLVMQYHKHLPIGILKHYMRDGHWNETRESVDKGMLQSVIDLNRLNLEKIKADNHLNEKQMTAIQSFIFTITHIVEFFGQLKTTYDVMPAYDKANIHRRLGNYVGVLGSMCAVAALWAIAGDDEDIQDSNTFNFWLYEFDRLASEAFMYNPVGFMSEGRKLMSSPIAAKSIIDDAFKTSTNLIDWMFSDEYDPYYHSGRFAGETKVSVYIQRRIPIWSAIHNTLDMKSSNHYYKLGENPIGLFNVKKMIVGDM